MDGVRNPIAMISLNRHRRSTSSEKLLADSTSSGIELPSATTTPQPQVQTMQGPTSSSPATTGHEENGNGTANSSQCERLIDDTKEDVVGRRGVVTELTSHDVLLGRGVGPNEHLGNVRYRDIVKAHQPEYLSTISRSVKDNVAHKTILSVKENGGRFLKRLGKDRARTLGFRGDVFVVADSKTVLEKTKQALRFQGRNKGTGTSVGSTKSREHTAITGSADVKKTPRAVSYYGLQKPSDSFRTRVIRPLQKAQTATAPKPSTASMVSQSRSSSSATSVESASVERRRLTTAAQQTVKPPNVAAANPSSAVAAASQSLLGLPAISVGSPELLRQLQLSDQLLRQLAPDVAVLGANRVQASQSSQARPILELLQLQQLTGGGRQYSPTLPVAPNLFALQRGIASLSSDPLFLGRNQHNANLSALDGDSTGMLGQRNSFRNLASCLPFLRSNDLLLNGTQRLTRTPNTSGIIGLSTTDLLNAIRERDAEAAGPGTENERGSSTPAGATSTSSGRAGVYPPSTRRAGGM